MSTKWDNRYRGVTVEGAVAAAVLRDNRALLGPPGLALDLACGLGANTLLLCQAGFRVHAWDLSTVAIEQLEAHANHHRLPIDAVVRDVVAAPPPPETYDLIVVSRFLERALCPALAAALRPGGRLFYQTFFGAGTGPSNPAYRLRSGELPQLFAGLEILVYGEESATGEAHLIAQRAMQG